MKFVKNCIFVFIIFLLISSSLQKDFQLLQPNPLYGYFVPMKKPVLRISNWCSGTYQDSLSAFNKENSGFRNYLVRLHNQVDYSLFSIPNAEKIVQGKDGYLFKEGSITSWLGWDFAGKKSCNEKIALLKKLKEKLKEKNIQLLVIFTPDKSTFYPEYIPDRFLKQKKEPTNYSYYAEKCAEAGINIIDFDRWFVLAKDTSRFILYPKAGVHWSNYGAVLAADSLLKYLRAKMNFSMPQMVIDSIETSSSARNLDDDVAKAMNLIWKIPHPVYAYPKFHFVFDTTQKKPAALFVGDSYYWNWSNTGIIRNLFSNEEFWYYCRDVYPESNTKKTFLTEINIEDAINRQNIIILIQVNGATGNLGYGFLDVATSVFDTANSRLLKMKMTIRNDPKWFKLIREKAEKANREVEQQLHRDAMYMLEQERKKTNLKQLK